MKSRMLVLLSVLSLAATLLLACKPGTAKSANSQSSNDNAALAGTQGPTPGSTPGAVPTPTPPGYHALEGRIDKQDISMKLTRTGNQITGTYQYKRIGKDIPVKGTITGDDSVELQEFGAGGDKPTGWFMGNWEDSDRWPIVSFSGNWSKTKDAKDTLFFSVSEQVVNSALTIETVPIKDESKKPKYTADFSVPRIVGSSNPNAEKFNQLVKADLTKQAADFKKQLGDDSGVPKGMDNGSEFDAGFEVLFANEELISVQFDISPYSAGAAHPGHSLLVFNYNLKEGRLYKLSELFKPGSNYLEALSKYCTTNLLARLKPDQQGGMGSDPEWVKTGAAPKAENYQNWNLTKKGLLISFAPYEVASYADGPQYVTIPYSELKNIMNPAGPMAGF